MKKKIKTTTDREKRSEITQEYQNVSRELNARERDLKNTNVSIKKSRNKVALIQEINSTLFDRLDKLFLTRGYNGDPHVYANALKGFFYA